MFEDSDTAATTSIVYHNAGLADPGGSSNLDSMAMRDRHTTANGTLNERRYHTHDFKGNVEVKLKDNATQVERLSFTPYGQA